MTDNEIIKALECLASGCFDCNDGCKESKECPVEIIRETLNLINRQNEKIELLQKTKQLDERELSVLKINNRSLTITLSNRAKVERAEAIKEFAERLKETCYTHSDICGYQSTVIDVASVDNLVKEMAYSP